MSDTPRTDAVEHEMRETQVGSRMRKCKDGGWVASDFARELERENAALQELAARRAEIIDIMNRDAASRVSDAVKKLKQENNILRRALENIASMSEVLPPSTDEGVFARLTLDAVSDNPPPASFETKEGGAS